MPVNKRIVLATALLPVVTVNLCYAISVAGDHVPLCFTYLDGCTSISSTGRHGHAYWLFKALMLPQCVLLVIFWRALSAPSLTAPLSAIARRAGSIGAAFLVLYLACLGTDGTAYHLMRRYGVFVFFLGTFVAQCGATRWLARRAQGRSARRVLTAQRALILGMLILGLSEVPLGTFGLEDNRAENIIEWNFSLMMQAWFLTWLWADLAPDRIVEDTVEDGSA